MSIRPASPLALAVLTFLQSAPTVAATFTVDTTLNSNSAFVSACTAAPADCSFWGALLAADATQAEDTIAFAIPANQDSGCVASSGICRIETPLATLVVNWPIVIDGLSQAGASANTLSADGNGVDMNLKIELVRPPGATQNGLNFQRSVTLRGLSISRNPAQQSQQGALISFNNAGGDRVYRIESCIVGGRADGSTEPAPEQNLFAFQLGQCPSFTIGPWTSVIHVGGVLPEQRNWFLTGGPALQIDSCLSGTPPNQFDVRVEGNLFGTSKNGLQQLVLNQATAFDWIRGGMGNGANLRIGGANPAARNVFMRAASKTLGMSPSSAIATNVTVQGNYFGVAVDGLTPFLLPTLLPSNLLPPVLEVSRARIGGTGLGEGNLFVAHEATSVILGQRARWGARQHLHRQHWLSDDPGQRPALQQRPSQRSGRRRYWPTAKLAADQCFQRGRRNALAELQSGQPARQLQLSADCRVLPRRYQQSRRVARSRHLHCR